MTRLERKNREDIIIKGCGGLTDIFDDVIKDTWRINDDEYDFICEEAIDEELDCLIKELKTIAEKREALRVTNSLIERYRNKKES